MDNYPKTNMPEGFSLSLLTIGEACETALAQTPNFLCLKLGEINSIHGHHNNCHNNL